MGRARIAAAETRAGAPARDASARDGHGDAAGAPAAGRRARATPAAPADARAVRIERLILHQLDSAGGRLELVDEEVTLDERGAAFFAAYIASAAERADWRAAFVDAAGEVPLLCRQLLVGPQEFVFASRRLALRLYDQMCARPRLIAPGDFVVAVFRMEDRAGSEPHVALLKLDLDAERLVREFTRRGSRTLVRVAPAANLLPEARRLHKCALLRPAADGADEDGFAVTLLDNQAGPRSDGVAAFFYRGFLTAALAPSARRHTRLFLGASEAWLSAHAARLGPAQLLGFYHARRAALAGEAIIFADFARAALPDDLPGAPALRASLVAQLAAALDERGADAEGARGGGDGFAVDRATADPYVRAVTLELDGGARLKVDARLFDALARVAERRTGEGKIRLVLESTTLREVAGT